MLNYQPVAYACTTLLKEQGLVIAESKNLRPASFIILRWTGMWHCETGCWTGGTTYQNAPANLHRHLQP
jgi:hypothetical protein